MSENTSITRNQLDGTGLQEALMVAFSGSAVPPEQWRIDLVTERYQQCMTQPQLPDSQADGLFCPRVFDGWSCWNYTRAGDTAFVQCPYFVPGMDSRREAFRSCLSDGRWFRHPAGPERGWSNYTTCIDISDLQLRQVVNEVYVWGYSISLAAIIISLCIFIFFRTQLNSTRVRIHMNLFASFLVNNTMWIIWYEFVVDDDRVLHHNPVWCQLTHVFVQYFMVANYFWMFCEGVYLHTLLAVAFVTERRLMKWLNLVGWLLPLFFTIVYASVRAVFPHERNWCWMEESVYIWLLTIPVCISMVTNFIFLVHIVYILVRKLRESPGTEEHGHLWRAVRATLILIPLLGLNYMLAPFRPAPGATGENVYQIMSAVTTSVQGLCVAFLFCFFNGEVIQQVKSRWQQHRLMRTKPVPDRYGFTHLSRDAAATSRAEDGRYHVEAEL